MKAKQIKSKVLNEIMSLMSQTEGDNLKKHPKLISAKVVIADKKPEMAMEKMMGDKSEMMPGHEQGEPAKQENAESEYDLENLDPELLKKLMKLAK